MQYRTYGKTELEISVLTFGAMRIPFPESTCTKKERLAGEKNAVATIRRAMELGINHIDTARGYGNSERLVGLALKELGRDKFYVSTKLSAQATYDQARQYIAESLERMAVTKLDILDVHGINSKQIFQASMKPDGCLRAVEQAVREGTVGHASFSSHGGPDLLIPILETGRFSTVSLNYWLTHPRNEPTVTRARELNIGVLILSPAEKSGLLFKPTPELVRVCAPFSPLVLAHRWLLCQPEITTLTVGAAQPEEFDAHLPGADGPNTLTRQEQDALKRWQTAEAQALGNTRCTLCYQCMPCPQNVAIPEILRLRNLGKSFQMVEFGKMRYNLLDSGGDWFPGVKADKCNRCGVCLPRCPENLSIPDLLAETHDMLLDKPRHRLWT